jgi:predicted kinase
VLIVLGGLPGTGKTSIARELARRLAAMHVRIDTIEQTLKQTGAVPGPTDDHGYRVAYAIAEDNLKLGLTVIADSVNPVAVTRDAWRAVAERAGVTAFEVEIVCSDAGKHRRRVETRFPDIAGHERSSWEDVLARDYERWDQADLVIDTAGTDLNDVVTRLVSQLPGD